MPLVVAAVCAGCSGDRDKNKNRDQDRPKPAEKAGEKPPG